MSQRSAGEPADEVPERESTLGRHARLGVRVGLVLLAAVTALAVMLWEEGAISPVDGGPQALDYLLIAAAVWALIVAYTVGADRASTGRVAVQGARRWGGSTLLAFCTGAVIGTGAFWMMTPGRNYHGRWIAYVAGMRSDLRTVAEHQAAHFEQYDEFASSLDELGFLGYEGIQIDMLTDRGGWSAVATHLDLHTYGYPDAACVVFAGHISVQLAHRLPDGRLPPQEGVPVCDYGAYVPRARR